MSATIASALRVLAHFWLEEIEQNDLDTIAALPELAETIPQPHPETLSDLAVEYQRLFGFNLPPYESVFIDPSAMLMTPATERVQSLYREARWTQPEWVRAGAPDHVGLELLALADALEVSPKSSAALPVASNFAHRLHTQHLALWLPPLALALQRLLPHPFYATLAELTLDLILSTLPNEPLPPNSDPFPDLPPPPIYKSSDALFDAEADDTTLDSTSADTNSLRTVIKRLLPPREAGLFLTREDIARIGQALNSPGVMGERYRMLESLFQFTGQYDLVSELLHHLIETLNEVDQAYQSLAQDYPAWFLYADAWRSRLTNTKTMLDELRQLAATDLHSFYIY